jgi:hypothetical protein
LLIDDNTSSRLTVKYTSLLISCSGTSSGQKYQVELVLFKEIETEGSIMKVLPMNVQMKLNKKNQDEEFWPRLLSDKLLEKTNVKVDWDRYVDEDDEADGFDTRDLDGGYNLGGGMPGMGGMGGMPGMGGMGGMPGMGGMGGMGGMAGMEVKSPFPSLSLSNLFTGNAQRNGRYGWHGRYGRHGYGRRR